MDISLEQRIESYLSAVNASMGKVPGERRAALMLELREHIEKLVDDYEADGKSTAEAVEAALSMMGAAKKLGRQYASMWYGSTERGSVLAAIGVITMVSTTVTAFQNPIVIGANAHHLSAAMWAIVWAFALIRSCAGAIAGWFTPRGAVVGAVLHSLVYAVSISTMLLSPNVHFGVSSWYVFVAEAVTIPTALIGVRLRKRKFAGI